MRLDFTPNPLTPTRRDTMATKAELEARIKYLESLLLCTECGHLRHEHDVENGPCYGGRTPEMKSGEGKYCICSGFESEEQT